MWPAALGLATAIVNDVVGGSFALTVGTSEAIKGTLRPYLLAGGSLDALLIAIIVGDLVLTLIAFGRFRVAIVGYRVIAEVPNEHETSRPSARQPPEPPQT